jgi:hypothetical protein
MKTTISTNSGQFYAKINPYILNAIDADAYDKELTTDKEKLQFLADCFKDEYVYPENVRRYPNKQVLFAEWLKGLPSCFNIDYTYFDIITLSKAWGTIPQDASEKQEDKVCQNWFLMIAQKTFSLMEKHNVII